MPDEGGREADVMWLRAVRGATAVATDEREGLCDAVRELLTEMMRNNGIATEHIVSVFFTTTADLRSEFPARAAHAIEGWNEVPMICSVEIDVPGALPRCIRVLIHFYSQMDRASVRHVYLHEAQKLRPDLTG